MKQLSMFWKVIFTASIALIVIGILLGMGKAVLWGNYMTNASFITIGLGAIGFIILVYLAIKILRYVWTGMILFILMQSCNYAKSNQQVLVSTDCGMTWKRINAGDAVPKGVGNYCYMKVVIPNFPMQGECKFITNIGRARAFTIMDYDYAIIDGLKFINQAKYLGKANAHADDNDALDPSAFETAENMVIDKRIREVSKAIFLQEDLVELDQAELEQKVLDESNKILEPLGVKLNFITLTFDLDEQTRQAIDVATAMKIYESKNLTDIGKALMVARAGATKLNVENKIQPAESKE